MAQKKALYSLSPDALAALPRLQALGYASSASAAVDRAILDALAGMTTPNAPSRALLETVAAQLARVAFIVNDALADPNSDGTPDGPYIGVAVTTPDGDGVVTQYDARHTPPYGVTLACGEERWYRGDEVEA